MDSESKQIMLPTHTIATTSSFRIEEDGSTEASPAISLGTSETDSFNKMVIENTDTDSLFRLKTICFGTNVSASATNIDDIAVAE